MDPLDTLVDAVLPAFRETTREAGALALRSFEPGLKTSARVWSKSGGSPVTEADIAVDAFLKARLGALAAGGGWLSEETADDARRLGAGSSGSSTRSTARAPSRRAASTGRCRRRSSPDGVAVLGIVYAPGARGLLRGLPRPRRAARRRADRGGADRGDGRDQRRRADARCVDRLAHGIRSARSGCPGSRRSRSASPASPTARSTLGSSRRTPMTGTSPRADLILREAGGCLTGLDGAAPAYNRPEPVHGELVAAVGVLHPLLIEAMTTQRAPTPSARR